MNTRCQLEPHIVDLIGDMRERGLSPRQIVLRLSAMDVKMTAAGVQSLCLSRGFDLPASFRKPPKDETQQGTLYTRGGRAIRTFSSDEDLLLRQFDAEGLSFAEMGRRLDRHPDSVRVRLIRLALHDSRRDDEAA